MNKTQLKKIIFFVRENGVVDATIKSERYIKQFINDAAFENDDKEKNTEALTKIQFFVDVLKYLYTDLP